MYGLWSCAASQNEGLEVFCLDQETTLQPTNTIILPLTFGYHQPGINRPILDSLETVWDTAVSLLCLRLSHAGPDISTGTMYQSLVATLSLVYTALSAALYCGSGNSSLASYHPLTFHLKGLACVCVGRAGGDAVTKVSVEGQWIQRANNTRQCSAQGRLNICTTS